ncbi:MAG: BatD family protein [Casimicrobium sp.]|jgi:hypothetical protein
MNILVRRTLTAIVASGICLSTWAAVTASLDKTQVALGERVRLVVQNTGKGDQQPDISALSQDFDVLGTQRGSSMQITNGSVSSQTQFTVLLTPKHSGTIHIAPIQWGGEQSGPLDLTVGAGAAPSRVGSNNAADSQVNISSTLDQKQPYVQSAVVLNLRLNVGVPMAQASLDLQGNSDVLVRQLGKDQQHSESRNGRVYQVIERKYLLIPQRSGAISLRGPVLQAQVQDDAAPAADTDIDSFFGNVFGQTMGRFARPMRSVQIQGNAIEMDVKPRPTNTEASNWLPAQKLTLEETWRPEQGALHVGEPLTRHLHLSALGVSAGQLPDLASVMAVPDGIKKYPDQAKTDESLQGDTLRAERDQDIALIASAPGHYDLPALRLVWWDTASQTQRTAELPARSLDILPATGVTPGAVPAVPKTTAATGTDAAKGLSISTGQDANNYAGNVIGAAKALLQTPTAWLWVSAALAALWLGTLLLWWRARRRALTNPAPATPLSPAANNTVAQAVAPPSARSALSALQQACAANDARRARQHVLEWAAATWPQNPPRGLNSLTERLQDVRYVEPLQRLDRACYAADAPWNGSMLAKAFSQPPKPDADKKSTRLIPDLYD